MKIKYLVVSLLFLFFVSACTKISETEIGTGLIPSVDGVITKDTNIYVDAKNWGQDTISPSLYDDHALGYVNDPLFGTTHAAINIQMQPSNFPFTFEASGSSDSLMLDSVVLALNVRGVWGDSTQLLSLHVKEIDPSQTFIPDSSLVIYDNTSSFTATNDLTYNGMALISPQTLNDTVKAFQDTITNMLRIRLTDDFGNRLLHSYDSSNQYHSDSLFRVAFKGFQISADEVGNSLLRIGLASSSSYAAEPNTKLAIYYRYKSKDSVGKIDTTVKYFTINTGSNAHSNHIERNLDRGLAGSYYPPAGTQSDDLIYLQSSPGTYATITIDSAALGNFPNRIIHRAELLMEEAPDEGSTFEQYATSPFLFLVARTNDTTRFNIPGFDTLSVNTSDALFSSGILSNYSSFGGLPFSKTNATGTKITYYNFNLSRYVQGVITNHNKQYSFDLYTPYKQVFPLSKGSSVYGYVSSSPYNNAGIGRVRLYGGSQDSTNAHRMRLHIIYSIPH